MKNYCNEELEQLLFLAYYQKEIERRELAAQLVLTLGEECSDEMLFRVLTEECQSITVSREQLAHKNVEFGHFYVMQRDNKIRVVIPNRDGMKAEVYADYKAEDGTLAIGREAYQTMDETVYELNINSAEEFRIMVYRYPFKFEAERNYETDINN